MQADEGLAAALVKPPPALPVWRGTKRRFSSTEVPPGQPLLGGTGAGLGLGPRPLPSRPAGPRARARPPPPAPLKASGAAARRDGAAQPRPLGRRCRLPPRRGPPMEISLKYLPGGRAAASG